MHDGGAAPPTSRASPSPHCPLQAYITGGTKLPLPVLDLWSEFLQQGLLHSPDGGGLPPRLQRQLRRGAKRPARSALPAPNSWALHSPSITPSRKGTIVNRYRHTLASTCLGPRMVSALGRQLEADHVLPHTPHCCLPSNKVLLLVLQSFNCYNVTERWLL